MDGHPAVPSELVRQGVARQVLDADDLAAVVGRPGVEWRVEQPDDVRVGELAELLRLALQAAGGGVVQRDLEDALTAVLCDQERAGRGALAEHALDGPAR